MLTPRQVLTAYHLDVRCKLLEIAAILDRYDRAVGQDASQAVPPDDVRHERVRQALEILAGDGLGRAEKIARVFSVE